MDRSVRFVFERCPSFVANVAMHNVSGKPFEKPKIPIKRQNATARAAFRAPGELFRRSSSVFENTGEMFVEFRRQNGRTVYSR